MNDCVPDRQIRNLSARGGKAVTLTHSLAVSAFVDAWDCSARLQCDQQTPICSPYSVTLSIFGCMEPLINSLNEL